MNSNALELKKLLQEHWNTLEPEPIDRLCRYYELVLAENEIQNLTKLTSPSDFFWGHLWDVREWTSLGWGFNGVSLDLGSGAGIPGLPTAIVAGGHWVITDSEGRKADFVRRSAEALEVHNVDVFAGRAEAYLQKSGRVDRIVTRAVGKVEKIYGWLRPCSTWNTLVLMKGPGWTQEWADFQGTRARKELILAAKHDYAIPGTGHTRALIQLRRDNVPRGT